MIEYTSRNIMEWTRLGMRKAFGPFITEIAKENSEIVVLAADVADSGNLKGVQTKYSEQFYNIGIAEQNMTGIASGLAKEGSNVFIVSFAPFVSMRNYEAVRTLVSYMHLNVKIVALGSGLSLGVQGNTHYCMEDLSLMRTIPGLTVLSPVDVIEEAKCLEYLSQYDGPAYLRLTGIDGTPCVHKADYSLNLDVPTQLREGEDVAILTTGSVATECVRASRAMKKDGISCAVYDVCRLKPFDENFVIDELKAYKVIVTVEEHFCAGGLGSIVCEAFGKTGDHPPVIRAGIDDVFPHAADYAYLLDSNKLTAPHIRDTILNALEPIKCGRGTGE